MQNHERRIHDWIPSSVGCSKENLRGLVKEATEDLRTSGIAVSLKSSILLMMKKTVMVVQKVSLYPPF